MIKLTEIQIQLLTPLQENYKKSQAELTKALFLIAGKSFSKYEIKNNELIILDEEKSETIDIEK